MGDFAYLPPEIQLIKAKLKNTINKIKIKSCQLIKAKLKAFN
jgi:hypothetical protein